MKSLGIASLVSVLCVLWLPNHVVESTSVQILQCTVDNPNEGIVSYSDINVSENKITSTKMNLKKDVNAGDLTVCMTVYNEDDEVMVDQTTDFCSMSSNDMFKPYFTSFEQSEFNEGNCPVPAGSYSSGQFELNIDDGPEGKYKAVVEVKEKSETITRIECKAKMDQ